MEKLHLAVDPILPFSEFVDFGTQTIQRTIAPKCALGWIASAARPGTAVPRNRSREPR
jgi:hypothetical protein